MSRKIGIVLTGILLIGLGVSAQSSTGTSAVEPAVVTTNQPPELSPAEKLYQKAVEQREAGELKEAIQTASMVIALHTHDEECMPKTELLCAEIYVDLGLLDSADVTARQVQQLYEETDVAEAATALRKRIEQLKAEKESGGRAE